jgi:branched-chain amino acid transport system substrate-binding protein
MKTSLSVIISVVSITITILSGSIVSAKKTEILLGAINSMTGVEAMVGNEHRWAYQQAVKDINAKGGVYVKELGTKLPFRLMLVDDQSSHTGAIAAAEKLIKQEKVDFVLGTVRTPLNINVSSVAEKYQKLFVTTSFLTEMFEDFKYKWVVNSFFSIKELTNSAAVCLDPIPAADRPKNFCVLTEDNADGHGFRGGAKATLEKYGYNLAMTEYYNPPKDFLSSILRMEKARIDGIIALCSSTDGITFVRQIKKENFAPKYIWGGRGFWPIQFGESLGKDANYIISDGHWAEALGAPGSKELGKKYRAQFGPTKYSVTIGNFYSLIQALAQAIEAAGSIDNKKVRDVFYSGTFVAKDTTEGDLAFNEHGLSQYKAVALQWMDGKRMPVYPYSPDIWTLKLMPPWNER